MASFGATLEEAADADVIVHVVDASHAAWDLQAEVVGEALHGMVAEGAAAGSGPRMLMALNKVDRLSSNERDQRLREAEARGWDAVATSAVAKGGVDGLRARMAS